jgi:hypothetical protein
LSCGFLSISMTMNCRAPTGFHERRFDFLTLKT